MCTERHNVMKETQFADLWVVDEIMRLELSKKYATTVKVFDLVYTKAYSYVSYSSHAELMNAVKRFGVDMGNSHMLRWAARKITTHISIKMRYMLVAWLTKTQPYSSVTQNLIIYIRVEIDLDPVSFF
ncbi:hypothetical protein RvY_10381 [Ramazzottius varieornatus]|uniref:Uncharacterized protein n=1 Tax=Ramazzottius varieornatus TaxID=947166 RepID=A0A1D1VF14_RAMVA|nr:hypothetical protein RvY_10381 [Ramazzottius varieornatus]